MRLIGKQKLEKLKRKNSGNLSLSRDIDTLINDIEKGEWKSQTELKVTRPDADCVHSEGFYFFNIAINRTMILIEFVHDYIGYNYRLTNVNAALGCAQMESLDYLLGLKRTLAEQYKEFFRNTEFEFFTEPENCQSNYWLNAIITKDKAQRDEILQYSNQNGVMMRPIWELMNRLPMFADCQTDGLENSIWFADRVVNIPSSAIILGYRK